jgi:uncharacterized protein
MDAQQRLQARREEILRIAAQHGARNVRLFGSAARGETKASSDLDFLVEMEEGRSLLDLVGLWQDLEELLDCQVDVITDGGVSPYLRRTIYAEAVPLRKTPGSIFCTSVMRSIECCGTRQREDWHFLGMQRLRTPSYPTWRLSVRLSSPA